MEVQREEVQREIQRRCGSAEVAAEVQWCIGVELQRCRRGVVEVQWCSAGADANK